MRNSVVLRLAGAAALALMAGSVMTSPAAAFVGLSDRQANEVSKFIKCNTYLLKGDLASFEADEDCGKGPVTAEFLGKGHTFTKEENCHEWPSEGLMSTSSEGGDYCHEEDY